MKLTKEQEEALYKLATGFGTKYAVDESTVKILTRIVVNINEAVDLFKESETAEKPYENLEKSVNQYINERPHLKKILKSQLKDVRESFSLAPKPK